MKLKVCKAIVEIALRGNKCYCNKNNSQVMPLNIIYNKFISPAEISKNPFSLDSKEYTVYNRYCAISKLMALYRLTLKQDSMFPHYFR